MPDRPTLLVALIASASAVVACQRPLDEPAPTGAARPSVPSATAAAPAASSSRVDAPSTPPSASSAAPHGRVFDEATSSIAVKVGERFTVALPGSTSRPFEWKLGPAPDAAVVVIAEQGYAETPPPGCDGCGGYSGAFTFSFTATRAGTTQLRFVYARVAPPGAPPTKELTIAVRVSK